MSDVDLLVSDELFIKTTIQITAIAFPIPYGMMCQTLNPATEASALASIGLLVFI